MVLQVSMKNLSRHLAMFIASVAIVSTFSATAIASAPPAHPSDSTRDSVAVVHRATITTTKTQLQYFFSAHPDDLYAAWGLAKGATDNYEVFITLTEGEGTSNCNGTGGHYTASQGDYAPPGGWGYSGSALCGQNRDDSMTKFLDSQCSIDSTLCDVSTSMSHYTVTGAVSAGDFHNPTGGAGSCFVQSNLMTHGSHPVSYNPCTQAPTAYNSDTVVGLNAVNTNYPNGCPFNDDPYGVAGHNPGQLYGCQLTSQWYVGNNTARIFFDMGDGNLTTDELYWALKTIRANISLLPVSAEYGAVSAAAYSTYVNGSGQPICYANIPEYPWQYQNYTHPDHHAVAHALYYYNVFGGVTTGHPQYIWVTHCEPYTQGYDQGLSYYNKEYGVNSAAPLPIGSQPTSCAADLHTGPFQSAFGWLDFDTYISGCSGHAGWYWSSKASWVGGQPDDFYNIRYPTTVPY